MTDYVSPHPQTENLLRKPLYGLSEKQLAMLSESGISKETADAHKWRCVPADHSGLESLRAILNRSWRGEWGECLLIPYFDEQGKCVLWRVRPESPPYGTPKYLQPKGASNRIYFTNGVAERLRQRKASEKVEVVVTEGEKKALALWQIGFLAIALPGVECWHKPKAKYKLHADLQQFNWKGVKVRIVFDSDAEANEQVQTQRKRLADALEQAGATVNVVRLTDSSDDPADFQGAKVGVDDILARDGADGLRKLMDDAANWLQPEKPQINKCESKEWATAYQDYVTEQDRLLVYWHGYYSFGSDSRWASIDEAAMRCEALSALQQAFSGVSTSHAREAVEQTKTHRGHDLGIRHDAMPPFWLVTPPEGFENPSDLLITSTEVVNLRTGATLPRTQDLFCPSYVDVRYDASASTPLRWLDHLQQTLRHHYQIAILQEFFGWCLLPTTMPSEKHRRSLQKILMLIGPPGCGKGVIVRVQTKLLGEQHVVNPTLADLDHRFGASQLVGKSLAVIQEVKAAGPRALSLLKSISGEDMVTVEKKGVDPETMRLPVKIAIINNELVRFDDPSSSLERRLMILQAYKGYEKPSDGLSEQIFEAEAPGILNWAIEGWRRLCEKGFTELPDEAPGRELQEHQRHLGSPVAAFLDERCELGVASRQSAGALFDDWAVWCEVNGHKAGSRQSFGAKLRSLVPELRMERPRVKIGDKLSFQERVYVGVQLRSLPHGCERLGEFLSDRRTEKKQIGVGS